jgi:hypothetical protein
MLFNSLTQTARYFASKMQASSTQKTKDSAGRRLGYGYNDEGQRFLEVNKYIRMILLPVNVVSNGNQVTMSLLDLIRQSILRWRG